MIYDRICTAPEWDDVQQLILSTIASGMIYEQFRVSLQECQRANTDMLKQEILKSSKA